MSSFRQRLAKKAWYQRLSEVKYRWMTRISPEWNSRARWKQTVGRKLDLVHPAWYGEKLLFLKLRYYNKSSFIRRVASKDQAGVYVRAMGYGALVKTCYGVWDRFDDIPFDTLPDRFVLKSTTGCGSHAFCLGKESFDREAARRIMAHALTNRDHLLYSELQYAGRRRIMAEEFLEPTDGGVLPDDVKVHCFHGKAKFLFLCYERTLTGSSRVAVMDMNWEPITGYLKKPFDIPAHKPERLAEMIEIAETLAAPFPFVRVDFLAMGSRLVFGELTFTPGGGAQPLHTLESQAELGQWIDLERAAEQAAAWPELEKRIYG